MYLNLTAQVAQEFREAARWRSAPVPDRTPAETWQDLAAVCRAALRRTAGVRIARLASDTSAA